jgi:hypothetical protein
MRDPRTDPSTDDGDALRALPPDQMQAVVPTISAPIHHDPPPALEGPGPGEPVLVEPPPALDMASLVVPDWPFRRVDVELAAAALVAVWLATGDIRLGLLCGALVCASAALRSIDRRISFSYGEGFIGYRPDPAWPRGVQEDDDVRWDWRPHRASGEARRS